MSKLLCKKHANAYLYPKLTYTTYKLI